MSSSERFSLAKVSLTSKDDSAIYKGEPRRNPMHRMSFQSQLCWVQLFIAYTFLKNYFYFYCTDNFLWLLPYSSKSDINQLQPMDQIQVILCFVNKVLLERSIFISLYFVHSYFCDTISELICYNIDCMTLKPK